MADIKDGNNILEEDISIHTAYEQNAATNIISQKLFALKYFKTFKL